MVYTIFIKNCYYGKITQFYIKLTIITLINISIHISITKGDQIGLSHLTQIVRNIKTTTISNHKFHNINVITINACEILSYKPMILGVKGKSHGSKLAHI